MEGGKFSGEGGREFADGRWWHHALNGNRNGNATTTGMIDRWSLFYTPSQIGMYTYTYVWMDGALGTMHSMSNRR